MRFKSSVEDSQVGSQLQLGLNRNGQAMNLSVKTGQLVTQAQDEEGDR
ncbi:hypothetical protein [Kovacikia minuta]